MDLTPDPALVPDAVADAPGIDPYVRRSAVERVRAYLDSGGTWRSDDVAERMILRVRSEHRY